VERLIDQIINNGRVRIGEHGEGVYVIPDDLRNNNSNFAKELSELKNNPDLDKFNEILKKYNLKLRFSSIFKGDFSGYVNGLASKNKGNMFEVEYVNNFHKYAENLETTLGLKKGSFYGCQPILTGGENNKRPLMHDGKYIIVGGKKETVGDSVVDVKVNDIDNNDYNLSLKSGNTVTFINCGVKRLFSDESFNNYINSGVYNPINNINGVTGNELLKTLCINPNKFADVFTKYKSDFIGEKVKIRGTEFKDKKEGVLKFIESAVGYNYILVHKIRNKIHIHDLRKESDMKKLIGDIKSIEILYGGKQGRGKRVDVIITLSNMEININIRNKQGDVYPDEIMAHYKFLNQ
jgi:hypothetical protein